MFKVLFVSDSLGSGGAQRQMVTLAIGLKERGCDVSFLVYHDIDFFKNDLIANNIPIHHLREKNKVNRLFKIRKFIRSGNFDVVQSFLEPVNFACTLASLPFKQWKLIVGERSSDPKILKSNKRKLFRWFHLFADNVVSNSYENINIVKKINPFLSAKKTKVIYNIIDFQRWQVSDTYLPMKNGKINIVVAASHQYLKNAKGLIETLNHLTSEELNRLNIKWYGDESPDSSFKDAFELVEKYKLHSVIKFHDATNKIHEIMAESDVVALFSLYEGLPNTVCEGMAVGKVVISSNVSDVPILLGKTKELLFNPKDINEIAKVLRTLIKMNKSEMLSIGSYNRKRAKDLFNKENNINKYLNIYD
ncbi:glycosyltransferase family 4 protein [uncultured Nonlabens sp.]|jgi:glycosyltransferase involved in cell wall biosynthesis|uniref:glycosyltransferase family 4 protein n=1 Tax=uncultured Nonlabens sp. TaxID=859306 RepID=UPI0030D94467|tara:strand:- start:24738 stop:25823 length:1086 start_codon:yes stop_codon:yes gene_type:complete